MEHHQCICDSPYLGCHPVGTPDLCERCGGLVGKSAEQLANEFVDAMIANLRESAKQRDDEYLNGLCIK